MSALPEPMRQARRAWTVLAIAFYLVMLTWAAIPGQEKQLFGDTSDKLLHFCAYGLIALALYLGEPGTYRQRALRTIVFIAALGGIDETVQRFEAHRTPDAADWAIDMLAALAVAIVTGLRASRRVPAQGR